MRPESALIEVDGVMRSSVDSSGKLIHPERRGLENFWKWFAGSKAIDKQGRPVVAYHGTVSDIHVFDGLRSGAKSNTGAPRDSFFFSSSADNAASYAGQHTYMTGSRTWKEGANVMPVYLSLKRPLKVSAKGEGWRDFVFRGESTDINSLTKYAQERDYDGLIVTNVYDTGEGSGVKATSYVAFASNQIKSALGNGGRFDPVMPMLIDRYDCLPTLSSVDELSADIKSRRSALAVDFLDVKGQLLLNLG